jgi:hypothetical protein
MLRSVKDYLRHTGINCIPCECDVVCVGQMPRTFTSLLYQSEQSIIAERNVDVGHRMHSQEPTVVKRENDVLGNGGN